MRVNAYAKWTEALLLSQIRCKAACDAGRVVGTVGDKAEYQMIAMMKGMLHPSGSGMIPLAPLMLELYLSLSEQSVPTAHPLLAYISRVLGGRGAALLAAYKARFPPITTSTTSTTSTTTTVHSTKKDTWSKALDAFVHSWCTRSGITVEEMHTVGWVDLMGDDVEAIVANFGQVLASSHTLAPPSSALGPVSLDILRAMRNNRGTEVTAVGGCGTSNDTRILSVDKVIELCQRDALSALVLQHQASVAAARSILPLQSAIANAVNKMFNSYHQLAQPIIAAVQAAMLSYEQASTRLRRASLSGPTTTTTSTRSKRHRMVAIGGRYTIKTRQRIPSFFPGIEVETCHAQNDNKTQSTTFMVWKYIDGVVGADELMVSSIARLSRVVSSVTDQCAAIRACENIEFSNESEPRCLLLEWDDR